MNKLIRHIVCLVWFATFIVSGLQAGYSHGNGVMPDTARIRELKQELSKLLYINEQRAYYSELEQLARKTGDDALLAKCCYELSYIYLQQSDYPQTIKYVQRALNYYEAKKDKAGRASCYRIMGTLYLLVSPEQADLYYSKCIELSSREDSALAIISKCMMSIQPGAKNDKVFDDVRNINLKVLTVSQKATVDYLYAVMAHQEGDIDKAMSYISRADAFFTTIPQLGYMNALNKQEMASLYFARGDLKKARQALDESNAICRRDDCRLTAITNMHLLSDILDAEGLEMESLVMFKRYSSKRDSLLGLNQVRSLTGLLMRNLLDENVQEHLAMNTGYYRKYILLGIILILAVGVLYYFRDSFVTRKEKYLLLSRLNEQNRQIASNPELKQHLAIVIFEYKKGLDYHLEQLRNNKSATEDYQNLNRCMDEASDFIDRLKKWMDEQPYHTTPNARFEVWQTVGVIVRMLEIIFKSKQVTIQNNIGKDIAVFGNQIYFSLAFEIMLFRVLKYVGEHASIVLSMQDCVDYVTFTIALPNYVLPEEKQLDMLGIMQKMRADSKPPENCTEVCLKCIYENNGNSWFESNQMQGTVLNFSIPKEEVGIKMKLKTEASA